MSNHKEIKGSTAARVVGTLIILYGALIFGVSFMAPDSLSFATIILLSLSSLAIIVGIGLVNFNYHAWLVAIVLNTITLVAGGLQLILIYSSGHSADAPSIASKLFWPLIIFWLLYAARGACLTKRIDNQMGILVLKFHAPMLIATAITVVTIIVLKAFGAGGIIVIGFPLLIFEFAILYIVGGKIQKRFGWEYTSVKN